MRPRPVLTGSAARQNVEGGQGFAFQHFQESAAAGGDVPHLLLDAVLGNGGQGVATTGNRKRGALGDGLRDVLDPRLRIQQ